VIQDLDGNHANDNTFLILIINGNIIEEIKIPSLPRFLQACIGCVFPTQGKHYRKMQDLGACPRILSLLQKSGLWPDFPLIFVKYNEYSPQIIRKSTSNPLSLVTTPILGQAPRVGLSGHKIFGTNHAYP